MSNTYVYSAYGNLYFNLTNRCDNNCSFCIRNNHEGVCDNKLWISDEPTYQDIINQLPKDLTNYKQAVFCGFGEPTYRVDLIIQVASMLKSKGMTIRLDTNGHGNLINNYDIVPKLADVIDIFSVSLNYSNSKNYHKNCNCIYGESSYNAMIDFAIKLKKLNKQVTFSVVDIIGSAEVTQCKSIADKLNIPLRVRRYE